MMPHVLPSDGEKLKLQKVIESKKDIPIAFRERRCERVAVPTAKKFNWTLPSQSTLNVPRYIIVGFQTDRDNDQTKNLALFDHCTTNMIRAVINKNKYPEEDYVLSFPTQVARAYHDVAQFGAEYYGLSELITDSSIATTEYSTLYPLFVFDVSKHEEFMKITSFDIRIEATFNENVAANTTAYALIISDCICKFKSHGSTMDFVK